MGVRVFAIQVMSVVRGHERKPQLRRELADSHADLLFTGDAVILQLEPVVALAEKLGVPLGRAPCLLVLVLQQIERQFTRHAGRQADQSARVLLKGRTVDAGSAIKALDVPDRDELHQVLVAHVVAGEQNQVRVLGGGVCRFVLRPAIAEGDVSLAADDRLDAAGLGCLMEAPGAVQVAMIGEGEGRHLELGGAFDQSVQLVGAVQQRVFAVGVKVNERHGGYPLNAVDAAPLETG